MDEATDAAPTTSCPSCGASVDPGARYCTGCGTELDPVPDDGPDRPDVTTVLPAAPGRASTSSPSATAAGDPSLVRCPNCGVDNDADRELCVRCGVDLLTGATLPTLATASLPDEEAGTRPTARSVAVWVVPVLAVAAVVGAVVLGLWVAGVGPFADPNAPLDPVAFDPAAYPGEEELLPLESIASVTAQRPDGTRTFTPEHMVDGNQDTTWHSDPASLPAGVTEKVDLVLDRPAWVATIVLGNGDQTDIAAYQDTARVSRVAVHFDGGIAYEAVVLDLGLELQAIELPSPMLTTAVRLELLDVVGDETLGPAISRIDLRGWVADDDDAAIAEERADQRPAAGPITLTVGG